MPTTGAAPAKVSRSLLGLSVEFEITTKDGLRKVVFGLAKAVENDVDKWTIDFQLLEREKKSDAFAQIVKLKVNVSQKNNKKAERTAMDGLSDKQSAFAIGPAAAAAKAAETGELSAELRDATIESVVRK